MGVKQTTQNNREKCSERHACFRYLTCPYSRSSLLAVTVPPTHPKPPH